MRMRPRGKGHSPKGHIPTSATLPTGAHASLSESPRLYKRFPLPLNVWIHDILPFLGDPRYIWGVFTSSRSSIHAALGLLGTLRVENIDRIWWKLTKLLPLFTCESDTSSVEELEPKAKTKQKRPPTKKSDLPRHRKEKRVVPPNWIHPSTHKLTKSGCTVPHGKVCLTIPMKWPSREKSGNVDGSV